MKGKAKLLRKQVYELPQIKCYPGRVLKGVENISLPHGKMLPEMKGNEDEIKQSG